MSTAGPAETTPAVRGRPQDSSARHHHWQHPCLILLQVDLVRLGVGSCRSDIQGSNSFCHALSASRCATRAALASPLQGGSGTPSQSSVCGADTVPGVDRDLGTGQRVVFPTEAGGSSPCQSMGFRWGSPRGPACCGGRNSEPWPSDPPPGWAGWGMAVPYKE